MASDFLAAGTPAPPFTLTAVASNRKISPQIYTGIPLMINFLNYRTSTAVRRVVIDTRRHYPDHNRLAIINLIDLHIVPRLMRGVATTFMENAYRQAATEIPAPYDPADHLLLLPDWTGEIHKAYRVPDVSNHIAVVIVDRAGKIHGSYHGPQPQQTALELLESLLTA